jgi:hypothetical protein
VQEKGTRKRHRRKKEGFKDRIRDSEEKVIKRDQGEGKETARKRHRERKKR